MNCPNRNTEDYKELVDALGSTEMAHLVWDRNDGYPLDFAPDGSKSLLFDQLLEFTDNNRIESIRLKAQVYMDWYTKDNGLWYNNYKEEPKLANTTKYTKTEIAYFSLLDRLASKFGYNWDFAEEGEIPEQYGASIRLSGKNPVIIVRKESRKFGGIIHEFGHIFIEHIKRDNTKLWDNLVDQFEKLSEERKESIIKDFKKSYPKYSDKAIMSEIMTSLLEHYANKTIDESTGLYKALTDILNYIKQIISEILNITDMSKISQYTNIKELADIMMSPDIFLNLGDKFGSGEFYESYSGEYDFDIPYRRTLPPEELIELTSTEIKNKFTEHSKNFIWEDNKTIAKEKGHWKYKKDDSYEYLTGVKRVMSKFGYGVGEKLKEGNINAEVGKTIHGHIENIINDISQDISKKQGVKLAKKAQEQLTKIFKDLKGDYTALSEIVVGDVDAGMVGVIDLILISDDGKVMLFDFKTKIRSMSVDSDGNVTLDPSKFQYWNKSYKGNHTDRELVHLQLSMYAYMIERVLKIPISSISAIRLDATMKGTFTEEKVAGSVKSRKVFHPGDTVESIEPYMESEDIIEESYYTPRGDVLLHNRTSALYDGEYANLHSSSMENKEKLQKDKEEISFSKLTEDDTEGSKLVTELREELATRLKFAKKRQDYNTRQKLENVISQLQEEESVTENLYNIINNASTDIDDIIKEVNSYIKNDKAFTPGVLYRWKEAVQCYKSLSSIQQVLFNNPELIPNKKYVKVLDECIKRVGYLENLYKTEGRYLIAKWLTPYYNGIKVAYQDSLKADYRKLLYKEVKKDKITLDEFEKEYGDIDKFVNKGMAPKSRNIEKETFDLLYKELEIASRDISEITRWIDNMLDQSDPVSSALVSAFIKADETSRLEAIDMKYELSEMIEDLTKVYKKGINQSEESYYSFMLEHDKLGNPTQFLLRPYHNSFWEDVEKYREKESQKGDRTKQEVASAVKEFQKERRRFNSEEFDAALRDFVEELYNTKKISETDVYKIADFLSENSYIDVDSLEKVEGLSQDAIDAIIYWKGKNMSLFYEYDQEYVNTEWNKFMDSLGIDSNLSMYNQVKALHESKDPRAIFYTKIEEISKKANQVLPSGYRIYDRLPGVMKLNSERLKAGQSPLTIAKETMSADIFVRPEDIERGNQEYTNEYGRVKYYIPINYTAKIEPENQSYDIPGIFFKFWESCNDYRNKRDILPELEMTRFFINQRKVYKRNIFNKVVKNSMGEDDNSATLKDKTVMANMLNDWFDMALYGKKSTDDKSLIRLSDNKSIDIIKFVDLINRYTSLNLLGLNFVQGIANVTIGEVMTATEAIAHEYVSPSTLTKATLKYNQYLPGVLGDVSKNVPTSLGGMLYEEFDVLGEDVTETVFSSNTLLGKSYRKTSMFFMQKSGEHWLQNRFMLAMLIEKKAYDKQGNLLGSMLDQYEVNNGKLVLKENVDLTKSQWTFEDQIKFRTKIKGVLSRMHGEYGDLGRVALQRSALGRMAYMFRKFVMPGFRRRWASKQYMERLGQYTEGNYITTGKFIKNYYKELATFQLSVLGENWAGLSDHEKANIRRTVSEAVFLTAAIILASAFYGMSNDDDDDWVYGFLSYQAYRLKAELLFFTPKIDEAWSILRSPMASMAVMQNVIDLSGELFQPSERYERGPWKGQLKIKKTLLDFVPVYKQFYKARDIQQQISWFRND
jgi:hypothetical protein